ncbi:MAG TPA: hypothetical protein VE646_00830 [Actinomycetota bacterium]|jgi:hypothetical protein|nr:hypothetical protein [Actinomycetota bacterium]
MTEMQITELEPDRYAVELTEGNEHTSHVVEVPEDMLDDLGLVDADHEEVVRESFAFLLEREPATSILSGFSLEQIANYFPEYYDELKLRLSP